MNHLQNIDFTKIIIRSKRVILRAISPNDSQDIFKNFNLEITRYMLPSPAKKIEETLSFIETSLSEMREKINIQLVITDKKSGDFLGCCGLHKLDKPEPELGIWTKKSVHGEKLGREAISALVDWAKENTDFLIARYPVDKRNIPSKKIPESLGGVPGREFKTEGMSGNDLDMVEYRVPLR